VRAVLRRVGHSSRADARRGRRQASWKRLAERATRRRCRGEVVVPSLPRHAVRNRTAGTKAVILLGLSSAIGALGGYFIPRSFGASIAATGRLATALTFSSCFYAVCVTLADWHYLQTPVAVAPGLASTSYATRENVCSDSCVSRVRTAPCSTLLS
jgi:hypothetical protein